MRSLCCSTMNTHAGQRQTECCALIAIEQKLCVTCNTPKIANNAQHMSGGMHALAAGWQAKS